MKKAEQKERKVIIYIDNRELGTRIYPILMKHCIVEEKQLAVGDYLLSKRVAVERKTASDFVQSIVDGRLFKQLTELKDNFPSPILIIEGNPLEEDRNVHPNAIRGALASIMIDYNIPIMRTDNQLETAQLMIAIANREQNEKKRSNKLRGRKKTRSMNDLQEYLIAGLPNISQAKAKSLLKYFGSPEKVFTAGEKELKDVEGIGEELSKRIRRILRSRYEKSILED